jgi:hypothetical protein
MTSNNITIISAMKNHLSTSFSVIFFFSFFLFFFLFLFNFFNFLNKIEHD